jgi:hypothetical protein
VINHYFWLRVHGMIVMSFTADDKYVI